MLQSTLELGLEALERSMEREQDIPTNREREKAGKADKAGVAPASPMSDHAGGSHEPHDPKVPERLDKTLHDLNAIEDPDGALREKSDGS